MGKRGKRAARDAKYTHIGADFANGDSLTIQMKLDQIDRAIEVVERSVPRPVDPEVRRIIREDLRELGLDAGGSEP